MSESIQSLAKRLVDHGLQYAFGVTGSGPSLSLITELEDLGVRYYPVAHEAAGALMAGAVSAATGRVAASIAIKGPGLANMLPGIVSNHFEGNAALSISEAYGADASAARKHKRLDQKALLAAVVKGRIGLDGVEQSLEKILRLAKEEVPGPVHLDLAADGEASILSVENPEKIEQQVTDNHAAVLTHIQRAEKPVIIAGSLARRRDWGKRLTTLGIPVFTTAAAKGVLDESLPHGAGMFTGDGKELAPESQLFAAADLVVAIGLRNTEILSPKLFGKPLLRIDEVDLGLADGFEPEIQLLSAEPDIVTEVLDVLGEKSWGAEELRVLLDKMRGQLLAESWLPSRCFDVLNNLPFPHGLILDTGSFCTIGEHLWLAGPERFYMGSNNGRYMGVSIPSAIGLSIAMPGLPVFCAVGDGGMRMYPAEIKLAVQENLPVCFVLMSDGLYGSIACAPQPRPMSERAVKISAPSWARSVEAMGCEARVADSADAFRTAVHEWKQDGPVFIETAFDPHSYSSMTYRLR